MIRIVSILSVMLLSLGGAGAQTRRQHTALTDWTQANSPDTNAIAPRAKDPAVLRAQVLLDRAGFSPGEIDAAQGSNFRAAVRGFQRTHQLADTGEVGTDTWAVLNKDSATVLIDYEISSEDVAGPFRRIPADMMEKGKLDYLGYESSLELLGEKFHVSPSLLSLLNPGKSFDRAGEHIIVPNVENQLDSSRKAASVMVRKSDMTVSALDEGGQVIAQFPATAGSEHDPLPIGDWKINGVERNPVFHYNPSLFWDADPKHSKAKIPKGPNNPVGLVWIDLSKPHYGIHGTSEPSTVGHTQSHGCIRLTNWDALRLAGLVSPGLLVHIVE
jgi:lipoprotein-anchoring transpeptidase ErfK/SrfK